MIWSIRGSPRVVARAPRCRVLAGARLQRPPPRQALGYPGPHVATCLVTGGAGFLGSHLCDELLARGNRVICVDNFETGSLANIAHIRDPDRFTHWASTSSSPTSSRSPGLRLPPRLAGLADRLPAPAAAHAQGGLLRHPSHARPRQGQARALLIASTSEVYGDPHDTPSRSAIGAT